MMNIDDSILIRYLNAELPDSEKSVVEEWLRDDNNFREFLKLQNDWTAIGVGTCQKDKIELAVDKTMSRIRRKKSVSEFIARLGKIAAVFLIFLGGTWQYLNYAEKESIHLTYQADYGQIRTFTLDDSTQVTLNAQSTLKVMEMGDVRKVYLEGEGLFRVKSDPEHPFIVKTPEVSLLVTGTVFNVSAYSEDEETRVALLKGKLEMKNKKRAGRVLQPGESGCFSKQRKLFRVEKIIDKDYPNWQNNKIYFKNETVRQISRKLERWYGAKIVIGKAKETDKYRGSFNKSSSFEQAIQALSGVTGLTYKIQNDKGKIKAFLSAR